ncbi:MAG: hypothetical protein HZA51_15590 [Planctomycetes bacterium]|nr:hypothetical protein [Planctomycetota bacterium]
MKFDLKAKAPPIVVKVGDEEFKLFHRWLTAIERAAAIDCFNRGLGAAMAEWWSYILAWDGVYDMDGAPILIEFQKPDGQTDRSNFDRVIGRLPFIEQVRILLIQVAMNGIHLRNLRGLVQDLVTDEKEVEKLLGDIDPFFMKPVASPSGEPSSNQ